MRELALFAGCGGGVLGGLLLGWRTIGYVEINDYCQRIIKARIDDGIFHRAPVFGDIRAFIDQGYAAAYSGMVDVVSGGFPCQRFSTAARGRNNAPDLWPEMLQVIRIVKPRRVIAENVQRQPIITARDQLRAEGYAAEAAPIDSAELAAPHRRRRWWVVADANRESESRLAEYAQMACLCDLPRLDWWQDEPAALGVDDVVANRMERLRALGNGQIPGMAAAAWRLLSSL